MKRLILALVVSVALLSALPAVAQASTRNSGDAAHLYGYFAKPGMEARLDEGYRAHLRWHEANRDPLVWYGWYVAHGDRVGMFIDGSFGAPFAAFDKRIDPAGDGADAQKNFSPYVQVAFRASYRLRRELSTGFPLEQWKPSESVQVFHYTLRPGTSARFEGAVLAARAALSKQDRAPAHTWYALVVGGKAPGYMLMVARDGWAGYDTHDGNLEPMLAGVADAARRQGLLEDLAASIVEVEVETWNYREDLSLIPKS